MEQVVKKNYRRPLFWTSFLTRSQWTRQKKKKNGFKSFILMFQIRKVAIWPSKKSGKIYPSLVNRLASMNIIIKIFWLLASQKSNLVLTNQLFCYCAISPLQDSFKMADIILFPASSCFRLSLVTKASSSVHQGLILLHGVKPFLILEWQNKTSQCLSDTFVDNLLFWQSVTQGEQYQREEDCLGYHHTWKKNLHMDTTVSKSKSY